MFLLDTDTILYSLNNNETVRQNLNNHINDPMMICTVTLMELYYGAYKSQKINANLAKIKKIEHIFEIIPVDTESVELFGRLKAQLEKNGTPLDDFDLTIVSCALLHNLTLVSNNLKHFQRIEGLHVMSWTEKD